MSRGRVSPCPRGFGAGQADPPLSLYLGTITLIMVLLASGLLAEARADGMAGWALVPMGMLALLATGQLAVTLVNWLAPLLASPQPLPRMDFSAGIPSACRALVVVPTMLTSPRNVESLVEAMEVRFLAKWGREPSLRAADRPVRSRTRSRFPSTAGISLQPLRTPAQLASE